MPGAYSNNWLVDHAIDVIAGTYGDRVSVDAKKKDLLKFGFNPDVDTSYETVWTTGGDETYLTTNGIDSISSSNNSDTTTVTIEYHTVSGTGVDQQFTFGTQTVALTGQTRKALTTACARVSRLYVADGGAAFAGDVYVYENTALSSGVPVDTSKIHLTVLATDQQSQKAASTISNNEYYIVTNVYAGVSQKTTGVVQVQFQTRGPGGVFRSRLTFSAAQGGTFMHLRPNFIVPKNHDFRFRAIGSAVNLEVVAFCNGYIASVT
jgi:hypothetical protein